MNDIEQIVGTQPLCVSCSTKILNSIANTDKTACKCILPLKLSRLSNECLSACKTLEFYRYDLGQCTCVPNSLPLLDNCACNANYIIVDN